MSGDEAGARKPQIGDVWESNAGDLFALSAERDIEHFTNYVGGGWRHWRLTGHMVPVDHPGIEALRNFVDGRYSIGSVIDEHRALAGLLSLLAPSPGDTK